MTALYVCPPGCIDWLNTNFFSVFPPKETGILESHISPVDFILQHFNNDEKIINSLCEKTPNFEIYYKQ